MDYELGIRLEQIIHTLNSMDERLAALEKAAGISDKEKVKK